MRLTKESIYKEQRIDICNRIISILDLDEQNSFLLFDFERDHEKQQRILDMKDEIQQCFSVSSISAFKPNLESTTKRPALNIARSILRKEGYKFDYIDYAEKTPDGLTKRTLKYFVSKPEKSENNE